MKILITTYGTRGDIQPYIALGKGLMAAGYEVALGTSEGYQPLVEEHKLQYEFLDCNLLQLTQAVMGETQGFGDTFRALSKILPALREMMDNEWQAAYAFQPDLILYHPKCLGSLQVAERLQLPAILSLPLPFYTPTRAFPVPFLSRFHLGGWFNRLSYWLMRLPSGVYGGMINDFRRKTLGLPPLARFPDLLVRSDGSPIPILYPYSSHVLPVPEDFPPHVHVTGYWFLDRPPDWQPEPDLVHFLATGTAPVYIGFGSMGGKGIQKRTMIALEALQKSGQRGLLIRGWGGLQTSSLPHHVYMFDSVPHDWLFPQVAAVVHHGGAGTIAAGLRAGKPTIVCPFMADQPFWGEVIYLRGAGPKPVPQSRLTVDRLAEAITAALENETIKRNAAELGEKLRTEDGVARAVEVIGAILKKNLSFSSHFSEDGVIKGEDI